MKRFILTMVVMLACASAFAQNNTKMAETHRWTYGANVAYSFKEPAVAKEFATAAFGNVAVELNSAKCNYRTRLSLGWLERTHVCPFAALDAQYLLALGKTVYIYPSVGVYGETFHKEFNVAAQAGAGLELQFGPRFGIFAEGRYQHLFLNNGGNRIQALAGVKVAFGK